MTLLTVIGAWLVVSVLAAAAWSWAATRLTRETRPPLGERTRRRRRATASQAVLLAVAVALGVAYSRPEDWQPLTLVFLLGALALASEAAPLTIGRYRFTGGFVALLLAMALLGPAPAMAIGVVCVGVDAVRTRPAFGYLLNNLAAYATFPLVGGLALAEFEGVAAHAAACVVVAVAVNFLNFLIIAGHATIRDGDPVGRAIRHAWLPVLKWEIATGIAAGATVYGYESVGPVVVAGFAVSLAVLQVAAARIAAASADPTRHILKTP